MTSLSMEGLFHTGMIVDDLERAMADMHAAIGVEWATPRHVHTPLHGPNGIVPRETWLTYSLGSPHHIELIQQIAGDVFVPADGAPRLHHIGFWVDDLAAESARLESLGFPLHLTGPTEDGVLNFAYHDGGQAALYLELNERARKPLIDEWLRTSAAEHGHGHGHEHDHD